MQRWLFYFLLILLYAFAATTWAQKHISIEGTLLMMDDATPHVAVVVQAVSDGKVIATTLSDERGKYQFTQEQNLELEFELSDLERVLNDLFVNEVLERERAGEGQYEYRFRADLFRLRVRQAHSVWE